jgi:hypothetical protein
MNVQKDRKLKEQDAIISAQFKQFKKIQHLEAEFGALQGLVKE